MKDFKILVICAILVVGGIAFYCYGEQSYLKDCPPLEWEELTEEEQNALSLETYTKLAYSSTRGFKDNYTKKFYWYEWVDSTKIVSIDLSKLTIPFDNRSDVDASNLVRITKPFEADVLVADVMKEDQTYVLIYVNFPESERNFSFAMYVDPQDFDQIFGFETKEEKAAFIINARTTMGYGYTDYVRTFITVKRGDVLYRLAYMGKPINPKTEEK